MYGIVVSIELAAYVSAAACAVVSCVAYLAVQMEPIFWIDRVALHIPLVAVPVLFIWFTTMPKLLNLYKDMKKNADGPLEGALRSRASQAGLVAPFQLLALGALTTFYFVLVPPVPFEWLDAAIPVSLFALLSAALWTMHRRRSERAGRSDTALKLRSWPVRALRNVGVLVIASAIAAPFFISAMNDSRLPAELDMGTGVADYGGGVVPAGGGHHEHTAHAAGKPAASSAPAVSVTALTGPRTGKPDRQFTLTAEKKTVRLSSGKEVDAWTYNGQIPGPELRMKEGELVEVTLINKDIDDGVTIHWHGLDVPNAEDGVAGATQDAVMPGETHTYRFLAEQVGTFWYHSHQHSKEAVQKGLFGSLVVEPSQPKAKGLKDITVITHVWKRAGFAIGSSDTVERLSIAPGTPVRLRLINTDDWVRQTYTVIGTDFQVAAIDGTDLNKPGNLRNTRLELLTGGRYDVTFTMPDGPVFLRVGEGNKLGLFMSPDGLGDIPASPATVPFEPQRYGSPAPTPFDADSRFDREFTMILDNK
ncbi:MAG: multicopper oxidase, partial [Paenibacillus sp.]|nr:multicopper oxidase [Paenibacillus sp.]